MGNVELLASRLQLLFTVSASVWSCVIMERVCVCVFGDCMCVRARFHCHLEPYGQREQCWTGKRQNQLVHAASQGEKGAWRDGSDRANTTLISQEPEPRLTSSLCTVFIVSLPLLCGSLSLQPCYRPMTRTTWWKCRWKARSVRPSGPLTPQTTNQSVIRLSALASLQLILPKSLKIIKCFTWLPLILYPVIAGDNSFL